MTRDDLSPLAGDESEAFPCPACNGAGVAPCGGVMVLCFPCGGSGYGPPPPSLDREKSHLIQRLAAWAHRETQKQEN